MRRAQIVLVVTEDRDGGAGLAIGTSGTAMEPGRVQYVLRQAADMLDLQGIEAAHDTGAGDHDGR